MTKTWAFLFCIAVMIPAALSAAAPGTSAGNFLKIGVGARGSAMGGAQTAVVEDVTALYWNPAALTHLRFQEVSLMHYSLVEGIRYNQASLGLPTMNHGHFAVGINLLDYGDIQGYDTGALPSGKVEASNLLLTGSWARYLLRQTPLSGGFSVKYLHSKLAGYSASAPMVDGGLLYPIKSGRLQGLTLAATLRNLGPSIKYDADGSPLPQEFVLGAGVKALGGNLNLALDTIVPKDNDLYFATGLEYRLFEMLNLRVGFNSNSEFIGNGLTYGIGLKFTQWNLDYAFVPFGDLGDTNRISVGIRFGRALQMQKAEDQVEFGYRRAQQALALGHGVEAYSMLNDLLLVAPWHKPSVELKARIEKQFVEMAASKDKARMEAEIAEKFTAAQVAFDRDELVEAKKGFETILLLQPEHVGARVYLEKLQNRYTALAHESFKEGMAYFAAGDYEKAKLLFEKTLTIDDKHADARAQLEKTKEIIADATKREEEMKRLANAGDAYKMGLAAFQKNDFETALLKFTEVKILVPDFEEVVRYETLTKTTLANILFEQSQVHAVNGQLEEAVQKITRAALLNPNDSRFRPALEVAGKDLAVKNAQESQKAYKEGLESYLSGETDKAEKKWKKALELDSTNEDAQKALQKLDERKTYEKP
ncbi:MAG: PorV/PorQ family protein [Elusimicrobia bacterium]|nr:PorV/PorQ family protein [Candidatus Obscuribacterium magneticum]